VNVKVEVSHEEKDSRLTVLAEEPLRAAKIVINLSVSLLKSQCWCCSSVENRKKYKQC
jgi:hypothetical protein